MISICLGPSFPTAINGRLICTVIEEDNSFFAFFCLFFDSSEQLSDPWTDRSLLLFLNSPDQIIHNPLIKIISSKMIISSRCQYFDNSITNLDHRNVKVPPPRSYTMIFWDTDLSSPYANAADVGSLMIRSTLNPAIFPAFFVACL